jgi:hypothetical protein
MENPLYGQPGRNAAGRAVRVNDRAVSDLRRVTGSSVTPFVGVKVEDGDTITFKLMQMDCRRTTAATLRAARTFHLIEAGRGRVRESPLGWRNERTMASAGR